MTGLDSLHRRISADYRKQYESYSKEQQDALAWLEDEYNKMMHVRGRDFTFRVGDYYLTLYNETIPDRLKAVGLPTLVLPRFETEGLAEDAKIEKARKKENRRSIVTACYSIELYLWENTGKESYGVNIPPFATSAYEKLNKKQNERFFMDEDKNTNESTIEIAIDMEDIEVDEFE